ncbi:MAG: hypothetical protein M3R00_04695 [Pseudomonadota bacterium]|nr:hypothetical protein [Pseudomonadota bacterium]
MHSLKPTWTIAKEISRRHTVLACKYTLLAVLIGLAVLTLVFTLMGNDLSIALYSRFVSKYSGPLTTLLLFIHLVPSSWYAIIRLFDNKFKDFRLEILSQQHDRAIHPQTLSEISSDKTS